GRLVLGDDDLARPAEQVEGGVLELEADLLGDDRAAREDRDVLELGLTAVAEAGGLDGDRLEDPADLVEHQGRKSLALDVLSDDDELLAVLDHLVDDGQKVLDVRDLLVGDEDVRVLEHRLLTVGVRHEVGVEVALVETHALGELELGAEGLRLLDRDDALLADLVDRLGDELADGRVGGRDGRGGGDLLLGLDLLRGLEELVGDRGDGLLDALLEADRVGAGGDVAQALADERLGENG
ncbi:hypothetical protein ABE10_01880, partial [Bacillus toyonensis]|nr:hypothetical protein [Bacillus toyonensis]